MPVIDHKIGLIEDLQDPEFAEAYLDECWKLGPSEYELALQDVAEAVAMQAVANGPHNLGIKTQAFYGMVADFLKRWESMHPHIASNP